LSDSPSNKSRERGENPTPLFDEHLEKGIWSRSTSASDKGLQHNHSLRFACYVLNTVLGGGMSSRLFQEIRENRGLAYSVYSYLPTYIDAGLVSSMQGRAEIPLKKWSASF